MNGATAEACRENVVKLNFCEGRRVKPGSKKCVSSLGACSNALQCLRGAIRLKTHEKRLCSLFLPKGLFFLHFNTSTVLFFLCLRCSATLQCHPVPAVMGKGCGRASHQYSANVSVQTVKILHIYTNKQSRIMPAQTHKNKQTCINVCWCSCVHIYTLTH